MPKTKKAKPNEYFIVDFETKDKVLLAPELLIPKELSWGHAGIKLKCSAVYIKFQKLMKSDDIYGNRLFYFWVAFNNQGQPVDIAADNYRWTPEGYITYDEQKAILKNERAFIRIWRAVYPRKFIPAEADKERNSVFDAYNKKIKLDQTEKEQAARAAFVRQTTRPLRKKAGKGGVVADLFKNSGSGELEFRGEFNE